MNKCSTLYCFNCYIVLTEWNHPNTRKFILRHHRRRRHPRPVTISYLLKYYMVK